MVTLECANCGTLVDLQFLDDIVPCPNCGSEVSKEECRIVTNS